MGILSIAKLKREGAMKSGLRQGKLSKWKDDRGFGFIQPSSGEKEVFSAHFRSEGFNLVVLRSGAFKFATTS